jgi:hypothetical protein
MLPQHACMSTPELPPASVPEHPLELCTCDSNNSDPDMTSALIQRSHADPSPNLNSNPKGVRGRGKRGFKELLTVQLNYGAGVPNFVGPQAVPFQFKTRSYKRPVVTLNESE